MRIGLNLLHMYKGIGGVWNYVENLITELSVHDRQNRYVVFVTRHSQCLVPDQSNFKPVLVHVNPLKTWQRILYENSMLHILGYKYKIECFHWFANTVSPFLMVPGLVTIHDLLPLRKPGSYSVKKHLYLYLMLKITARKAASILPISNSTALDVIRMLNPKTKQIHTLPIILKDMFKPAEKSEIVDFKRTYDLPEKYWLYVANFYPHKNHTRLINAYSELKKNSQTPWPLVLRGDSGPDTGNTKAQLNAQIKALNLDHDVIWLPRLAYGELPALYSGAGALIFPSLFEGGGIPVIEAMACGCPVAASDIEVVKEFTNDAVCLFNGQQEKDIVHAMAKLQRDAAFRKELVHKGLVRSTFFKGEQVVKKLLAAYRLAVS